MMNSKSIVSNIPRNYGAYYFLYVNSLVHDT